MAPYQGPRFLNQVPTLRVVITQAKKSCHKGCEKNHQGVAGSYVREGQRKAYHFAIRVSMRVWFCLPSFCGLTEPKHGFEVGLCCRGCCA